MPRRGYCDAKRRSLTTKIAIHSGADAIATYRCVALLDTGSPQTFIRRDVLDRRLLVAAASAVCERPCSSRSWGGFRESSPLRASTSIRLGVQLFRDSEPTCSLAMWACVVPPSVMRHAVLLGRDIWMRLNTRSYHTLPPRPRDTRFFGDLTLSHHATTGVSAYAIDPIAMGVSTSFVMALWASSCWTSLSCSRSTWCAVMVPQR